MGQTTQDIVQKLWNLCNVLRDDGITYHQYVSELTYLLFLKMAKEISEADPNSKVEQQIPSGFRWKDLVSKNETEIKDFYADLLIRLGRSQGRVRAIFANASTSIKEPRNLRKLVDSIDALDWFNAKREGLGDLYEGLLQKNANEKKSGAGQYFTPRPLIDAMVAVLKPQPGEMIQDPAAGTGGFLICADKFIKDHTDDLFNLPQQTQQFQKLKAFYGVELVQDAHRLALMNLMLHDIEGDLLYGDTLTEAGKKLPPADLILTNPPFGTKKGGQISRDDFTFETSNKQLAFVQHVYRSLKPGGRAGVVVPDNVLFEDGVGVKIREDLMNKCDLHTILRLPTGIFYAQGVKTNVLFFTRGKTDKANTKAVWIYDLRTNAPAFGKRTTLTRDYFAEFEKAYGADPMGKSKRKDEGETGRFRCFKREDIEKRSWNLDITWLKDENVEHADDLPAPEEIAAAITENLRAALDEMEALTTALEGGESE